MYYLHLTCLPPFHSIFATFSSFSLFFELINLLFHFISFFDLLIILFCYFRGFFRGYIYIWYIHIYHIYIQERFYIYRKICVYKYIKSLCLQAYFVLLRFALLHFTVGFFTNWKFVATLHQASLSAPFFQQHLLTSCLCVTFW